MLEIPHYALVVNKYSIILKYEFERTESPNA